MLNNFVLVGDFIIDALKNLTFAIDHAIYWLVGVVYEIFFSLAKIDLLNTGPGATVIANITNRVYVIIGIVMVFVLAFNLLNYIIDPDKIKDKSVGASTFIKDIIIALVVISVLPTIFKALYNFQGAILEDGTIFNLVLGGNTDLEGVEKVEGRNPAEQGAGIMIASVYTAFLRPNIDRDDGEGTLTAIDCANMPANATENFKGYCEAYKLAQNGEGIDEFKEYVTNGDFEYTPFLTTIAGIALLIFVFIFCFQLAKRVGKLAILQLAAPIPLMLEILPNKKGSRKKWVETLIKVYIDAFAYLLIISFIVLLITLVPAAASGLWGGFEGQGPVLGLITTVILIFGLLMFAKEAPQMLMDLLGIKDSGSIKDAFGMAKRGAGMAAFVGGTAGSMFGNAVRNWREAPDSYSGFKKFRSAVAGAGSSLGRNVAGARNVHSVADANNLRRATNQTVATNRNRRARYAEAHGNTLGGIMRGHAEDLGQDIRYGWNNLVGGAETGQNSHMIGLYDNLIDTATKAKDNKRTDNAEYGRMVDAYNNSKTNDFVNSYEGYKQSIGNPNASEADYINWMETGAGNFRDSYSAYKGLAGNENASMDDYLNDIAAYEANAGYVDTYNRYQEAVAAGQAQDGHFQDWLADTEYSSELNNYSDEYYNTLEAYDSYTASGGTKSMDDYFKEMSNKAAEIESINYNAGDLDAFKEAQEYALTREAFHTMDDKGASLDNVRRNGKVKTAAADLKILIDNNPELANLQGKDNDGNPVNLVEEFNKLVDKDGRYVEVTTSDTEVQRRISEAHLTARDTDKIESIRKQVNSEKLEKLDNTINSIRIAGLNAKNDAVSRGAADRYREQQRQARHPNDKK